LCGDGEWRPLTGGVGAAANSNSMMIHGRGSKVDSWNTQGKQQVMHNREGAGKYGRANEIGWHVGG
jgi:hypothetical protein